MSSKFHDVCNGQYQDPESCQPDFETLRIRIQQYLAQFERYAPEELAGLPQVFPEILKPRGEQVLCAVTLGRLPDGSSVVCARGFVNPFLKWGMVVYDHRVLGARSPKRKRNLTEEESEYIDSLFEELAACFPVI